ncbi:MAG: hypothetical protein J2P25_08105 [Nocardiopsaceae bacterium]|nr:hypothetical protein [Nocardiopsaceae bacterium]
MRKSTRIGIVGSSVAVAGSAALAAFAPSAGATPSAGGAPSSSGYHSSATATVGAVDVAGVSQSLASASATTGNSPASDSIGSGTVLSVLQGVPAPLGPALVAAFNNANPGNTDLVSESATASANGTSTACAAILSANCTTKPMSLILRVGLGDLTSSLPAPLSGLTGPLKGVTSLAGYSLVLSINGPRASCTAGPAGSGEVSATDNPGGVVASITDPNGQTVPGTQVSLQTGDIFAQLPGLPSGLGPLTLTFDPNSRKYTSGSVATATTGELGLSAGSTQIFNVTAAKATCGPNKAVTTSAPKPSPSGAPAPAGSTTSGEKPLSGIQTDEGRSSIPAADSYLALNGMP